MLAISSVASTSRAVLGRSLLYSSSRARSLCSTASARKGGEGNPFDRPAPPPLPPKEQREFEELVKKKANSLQFKLPGQGEEMHPQYRMKPKPDFEGDVNPETGESGGPKKDPLKWQREWSYGGRATDF